jgi:hypothetical protein
MRDLDLAHASTFLGMKKKRDATDEGKRKKKKAKGADEEEWDSDGTSDDDDDANDEDDEGPSTPVRTRGAKSKEKAQAAPRAAGGTTAGKWATTAKEILLEEKGVAMGEEWKELVTVWWELEESTKFATSVCPFVGAGVRTQD